MTEETILALTLLCAGGWGIFLWLPRRKRGNRRVSRSAWKCRSAEKPFKDSRSSIEQFNRIMGR